MFDHAPEIQTLQRSFGRAEVALSRRDGAVRLDRLAQSGSAKAILPRVHSTIPEVVFLNTSGGLTGGDRLHFGVDLGPDARATVTTQTAERAYASTSGAARASVGLNVGAGGWIDWLPQETILFQNAVLERDITLTLAPGAGCLFLESLILGRHAMGETLTLCHLTDRRLILRRDGQATRPLLLEPLQITPESLARRQNPAILGGARALATLALVCDGAADALPALRASLTEPGVNGHASAFDGKCILRLAAHNGLPLRRQIAACIRALRPGPLPRVWQI